MSVRSAPPVGRAAVVFEESPSGTNTSTTATAPDTSTTPRARWTTTPTWCVLELLYRALDRQDVFASPSNRWSDPRARLLDGACWEAMRADDLH
jgi:hypothetical protein